MAARTPATVPAAPALRRELGLLDAVAIGLGAVIGAGLFVVTGIAAGVAGAAILPALLLAGAAATANALSSAELAARYPESGGTYAYGYHLLGAWPGFAAGWMFLASKISAAGTVALGLAGYLAALAPGVSPRGVAVAAAVVFTLANYVGIRRTSRLNLAIVGVALASLLVFVVVGAGRFDPSRLGPFAPAGWRGVLEAAALLFFAYTGYARVATLGEEVREPRRTIPRAIGLTLVISVVLYLAVAAVALGAVGAEALAATPAPLEVAARGLGVPAVRVLVAGGGVVAMLGVLLSQLLGLSRMAFAMARRGDLPRALAHVDARRGVPDRAVLATGAVVTLVAATGSLRAVAAAASFTILVYYGIANLAALRLPAEARLFPRWVPAFGLVACSALAVALPPRTFLAGVVLLAVGVAGRAIARRGIAR